MKVFVAGGSGVIGCRLVRKLVDAGHRVTASTTSIDKVPTLTAMGADAVLMNGLDANMVVERVVDSSPDVVVHQMTALAGEPNMRRPDRWFAVTDRLRTEGTDNLLAAAEAAGASHFVAQSYAGWPYERQGTWVKSETDPLDPRPTPRQRQSVDAIRHLEHAISAAPLIGTVLRYGLLYGPGVSDTTVVMVRKRKFPIVGSGKGMTSWLQIDDAVMAVLTAIDRPRPGVYNIVDDEPAPVAEWLPFMAEVLGAKPPVHLPKWIGRLAAGPAAVALMTEARGASNKRAKDELGWLPHWTSWREGFRHALTEPGGTPPAGPIRPI
jgi:nucleoside-diphosphate-sugar epimerase